VALYQPIVPARYAMPLLDYLRARQPDCVEQILTAAGLDEGFIQTSDAALTMAEFDALLCSAVRVIGRNDLGYEMALRISIESHQLLGLAMRRCRTADEMLRLATRFSRLLIPSFSMRYRRTAEAGELSVRPAADMSQTTLYAFEELYAVTFHKDYSELLDKHQGLDIYLSMPRPAHVERFDKLYPTRFHFAALALPEVRCVFPLAELDTPIRQKNLPEQQTDTQTLQKLQEQMGKTQHWGDWVRLMLREAEGCQPSREELASLLNVSQTTLTRNLAKEGVNLRALGNQIRHQRACAMLRDSSQSVAQIAYRLGYSSQANFSSAFHHVAGICPRRFRQQGRASEA
jgi:AraC-like DNA-binding protein